MTFQSTPSGGKATSNWIFIPTSVKFQSTPSGGKATHLNCKAGVVPDVSIHAFRGEGDYCPRVPIKRMVGFQSTPSGGKATNRAGLRTHFETRFNPRLPGGRRLEIGIDGQYGIVVSIHAFRGEGDQNCASSNQRTDPFQSTPSGGKATPNAAGG